MTCRAWLPHGTPADQAYLFAKSPQPLLGQQRFHHRCADLVCVLELGDALILGQRRLEEMKACLLGDAEGEADVFAFAEAELAVRIILRKVEVPGALEGEGRGRGTGFRGDDESWVARNGKDLRC